MTKKPATKQLTIVLVNYAREEQMHELIGLLRKQTVNPYIWVWNNDVSTDFRDDRVDWIINSTRNIHGRCVSMLYQMAPTPFVMSMDDDLYPADDKIFEDALQVLRQQKHRNQIVGAYGVRLYQGETYENSHQISVPKGHGQKRSKKPVKKPIDLEVDVVKGRVLMLRQDASHILTCGFLHHHTDLNTSIVLAGRHRFFHTLAGCFWNRCDMEEHDNCKPRLIDFPLDDKGYSSKEGHYRERDELCQAWARTCLPNRHIQPKPPPDEPPPEKPES